MSFSAPWYLENYFIVVLQREIAHHVMDAIGKQSIFLLIKYTETTPIFTVIPRQHAHIPIYTDIAMVH